MSNLYPFRRIPQGMVVIGSMFVILSLVLGVGHFGFGVSVYDRNTGNLTSDTTIGLLLTAFAVAGILLAWLGRLILRAAARHRLDGSQAENVR